MTCRGVPICLFSVVPQCVFHFSDHWAGTNKIATYSVRCNGILERKWTTQAWTWFKRTRNCFVSPSLVSFSSFPSFPDLMDNYNTQGWRTILWAACCSISLNIRTKSMFSRIKGLSRHVFKVLSGNLHPSPSIFPFYLGTSQVVGVSLDPQITGHFEY